jgi:aspartate/methionine/tyrosine aminotransferase
VYGEPPASALGLPGEVVLVNSFSKYFCMTGWRLGWVVLPAPRLRDFEKLAQHFYICAPSAAQHAALAAFEPATLQVLEGRRLEFQRRRDFLLTALERTRLAVPARPSGAFYVYADCAAYGGDAKRFALEMLEQAGVAATPGLDFGANGTRQCLRFAYTRSMGELEEAAARIAGFCASRR